MPRSGGTYTLPSGNPVVTGTTISSSTENGTLTDIAAALTASLAKDGQTIATANLPMGTFKHTGVSDATARNQYAAAGQVQDGSLSVCSSVAGTDTITASLTPAITSYSAGMIIVMTPAVTNTGATTLAVNGLTALDVQKLNGAALEAGDLVAGVPAVLVLDTGGDDWILLNPHFYSLNGSFPGAFTGFSGTAPTGTIAYVKAGNLVNLSRSGASVTGTSNAVTMTITGMPAVIWPDNSRSLVTNAIDNNVIVIAGVIISSGGVLQFGTDPSYFGAAGFTASGTKGIPGDWTITYPIYGPLP